MQTLLAANSSSLIPSACMGHRSPKYASGGRCVQCTRIKSAAAYGGEYKGNKSAARANIQRAIANLTGQKQYVPSRPCKHGHLLRWVSSNNCVECNNIAASKRREKASEVRLLKLYGLDFAAKEELRASQNNACPICRDAFTDERGNVHIDHSHETGKVRSLLCSKCNQGLGLFRDSPVILRDAANYVEFHAAT